MYGLLRNMEITYIFAHRVVYNRKRATKISMENMRTKAKNESDKSCFANSA